MTGTDQGLQGHIKTQVRFIPKYLLNEVLTRVIFGNDNITNSK